MTGKSNLQEFQAFWKVARYIKDLHVVHKDSQFSHILAWVGKKRDGQMCNS